MRTVRRTIDIGHGYTKFINYQKDKGSILYSAFPSTIHKLESPFSSHGINNTSQSNFVKVLNRHYIVGQEKIDSNTPEEEATHIPFISYYMALVNSALARMDENVVHELYLTAPLSRISWLSKRLPGLMNKPLPYPNIDPIIVKRLRVVPACFGSFLNYAMLSRNKKLSISKKILVVDAGTRLTEWLPITNLSPQLRHSGFLSLQLPDSSGDQHQEKIFSEKLDLAVERIRQAVRQNQCSRILLTGGGANLYRNRLQLNINDIPVMLAPDKIYSNVLGYQRHL